MGNALIPGLTNGPDGAIAIDDGTLARTEAPPPGAIGLDASSGTDTHAARSIAQTIVGFARRQHGSRVGDGECFALADRALSGAGARSAADFGSISPDADYVWGTPVALADLQPGDVIQFRGYRYDRDIDTNNPDGSGSTQSDFQERPHHTGIVETVIGGGTVTVLEQNAPRGSAVRRSTLFFTDGTTTAGHTTTTIRVQGTFWFFRPQPR